MDMDQKGFSVLMFVFAALILLYAMIIFLTKDIRMIPRAGSAEIRNKEEYAMRFAKVLAAAALAPLTGGLIALRGHMLWAGTMLIFGFAICMREGVKIMEQPDSENWKGKAGKR